MEIPPTSTPNQEAPAPAVERRLAEYHPSIWGDHFLQYDPDLDTSDAACDSMEGTIQKLIAEVNEMLTSEGADLIEKLELIDQVQRLGIAYRFEKEMNEQLSKLHDVYPDFVNSQSNSLEQLYAAALFFRLLRQQGYNVSSEVFAKFKDDCGKFGATVVGDVRGMLGLYEASHMMVHGEDILQEALDDTTSYLKLIDEEHHSPHLVDLVKQALKQPIRKGYPRLEAWRYIQIYQSDPSHNQVLLSLAKLDFNSLQKMHQKEVCEVVRWWKQWDFPGKLPFARDRVVECYFWILGVYFEPEFAFARKFTTKTMAYITVMDDMYDAYGTWKEVEAYTEALQKWDEVVLERLPDYMHMPYRAILAIYREAEMELASQGHHNRLPYAIQSMKDLATGYLAEVKWFYEKYKPTLEEYIVLASLTCSYPALITNSLVGMGGVVTEDAFKWLSDNPPIFRACNLIGRVMDDVVDYKFQETRGHVDSAVECYMNQYGGTELEAMEALNKRVFDAWKDINEALLHPFPVPMPVLTRLLNFARVMHDLYKDGEDIFTLSDTSMKRIIGQVLVDPLPM